MQGTTPLPLEETRAAGRDGLSQVPLPLGDSAAPTLHQQPAASTVTSGKLWFCVYLPYLPLEACGSDGQTPLAVIEEQQGIHRVLLANPAAMKAGVGPGQSANAALALSPDIHLEMRCRLREQQVLERLAGWLESFSSLVSMAADDVLLLEIAGSLRLFGGLRELRRQVAAGLREQGFSAGLAIAPAPLAATWLARSGRRVCVRAPQNLAAALRELPVSALCWPVTVTESLSGVGVTTIGDCLRLPREGFARRFGVGRLLELDRALGRLPDPRTGWRAPERFCADHEMFEEQSDPELLLAICNELLLAFERFLVARQLGTQRLQFSFYHLRADATTLSLACTRADRSAARWFELLRIRFERLQLPEAVIAVRLRGGHTQAFEAGSARLAFEHGTRSTQAYSVSQLAERLAARIGGQSVIGVTAVAEHRPQYAWASRNLLAEKVSEALSLARQSCKRPLWMLPEPALLPADDGHPLHLGRLRLLDGPERLETGWWDDDGIARDYYEAINPRGMRLWIFRDRSPQTGWYLHGFFG